MLRKWRHCGSDLSREGVSTLTDQPYIEGGDLVNGVSFWHYGINDSCEPTGKLTSHKLIHRAVCPRFEAEGRVKCVDLPHR